MSRVCAPAKANSSELELELVPTSPQDPDADASFGTTLTGNIVKANPPLRAPVQAGDEAEVRRLIEELGEDIFIADSFWMTMLHYAAQNNYESIARLLIELGFDVNAENKVGE